MLCVQNEDRFAKCVFTAIEQCVVYVWHMFPWDMHVQRLLQCDRYNVYANELY